MKWRVFPPFLFYLCNLISGMKKVAFYTLGCKLNFAETSTIGQQLMDHGFAKAQFTQGADLYVINTCS